jgi:hypothetical protein
MENFEKIKSLLWLSVRFNALISILAVVFRFVTNGNFGLSYIFPANFLVGAVIIVVAFIVFITPAVKNVGSKLIDHTTFAATFMQTRENSRNRATELLYLGLAVIIIPALIQLILAVVL